MNLRSHKLAGLLALTMALGACGDDDPVDPDPTPDAPAQVINVTVAEQNGQLVISWAAAANATSYNVERDVIGDNAGFSQIANSVAGTTYTDSNVTAGTTYLYRISGVGVGGTGPASDPEEGMVASNVAVLSGSIDGVVDLDADMTYIIRGIVLVEDGGVLNIPAGTLLQGDPQVQPSAVFVRQGGQINSMGTADDPVVFTSGNPEGERRRGDWGGVVVNGQSLCNFPEGQCVGEGSSGPYGGTVLDDDSGMMVYTRIEFAGFEVSFGNELNALTLNGVGSGTTIHHVQTHMGLDDGVELFGGTVDLSYIVASGISDDSIDYSTGWQGRGQFWLVVADPSDGDNGFEVDGNEDDFDAEPFTAPEIYNVTLLGKGANGAGGTDGEVDWGLLLRRGTGGNIYNTIVMGWGDGGVDFDNPETVGRATVQNSIFFENATTASGDDDGIDDAGLLNTTAWNNTIGEDPQLAAAYTWPAMPDATPAAGGPADNGATPPNDGFFDVAATYIGAVAPGATELWYAGWTSFINN